MKHNFYPFNYNGFRIIRNNKVVIRTKGTPIPKELNDPTSPVYNTIRQLEEGHYCGYVAFSKWKIPISWWSNYRASGLQYLGIHGGITYAHTNSSLKILQKLTENLQYINRKIEKWYKRKFNVKLDIEKVRDSMEELAEKLDPSESWKQKHHKEIKQKVVKFKDNITDYFKVNKFFDTIDKIIEGTLGDIVIFGFDCAHAGDENNTNLKDNKIVLLLVEQMERQLLDFAKIYKQYLKASREDKMVIIDKIRSGEKFKTEIGLGAMIDILAGGKDFGGKDKNTEVQQLKRMWKKK